MLHDCVECTYNLHFEDFIVVALLMHTPFRGMPIPRCRTYLVYVYYVDVRNYLELQHCAYHFRKQFMPRQMQLTSTEMCKAKFHVEHFIYNKICMQRSLECDECISI